MIINKCSSVPEALFYVRATIRNNWSRSILTEDQRSIGILLCKTPKKIVVEYSLEGISSPLGVAEYQIMNAVPENLKGDLPSIEEREYELGALPVEVLKGPVDA